MWSYYGAKTNIVDHYPRPKFDKIIEPFAGSARYALKYFDRDVLLVDKYDVVVKIWKWLQQCSPNDILRLPTLKKGDNVKDFKFDCGEAQLLMRFIIGGGLHHPNWKVSPQGFGGGVEFSKKKIAGNLYKIKHWEIVHSSFLNIPNQLATWFIDPPYQFGGHKYKESNKNIDFSELASWCKGLDGQIIVCENLRADWLDFKPMVNQKVSRPGKYQEAIYTNEWSVFDNIQTKLIL